MALKGGHCLEAGERRREPLEGSVYCENMKGVALQEFHDCMCRGSPQHEGVKGM